MKKSVFTVFSAVALAGALAACSDAEIEQVEQQQEEVEEVTEAAEEVVEEAPEEEPEAAPAEQTMSVGDAATYDDLKVTVNSARKVEPSGDEWTDPENDYFVVLDVAIENTGGEAANVSSMMNFSLYDADSYEQELSIFADTKGSLDGEIGAGRKLAGEIAFDVTASETFEFIFEDPFKGGQAIWVITQEDLQQ